MGTPSSSGGPLDPAQEVSALSAPSPEPSGARARAARATMDALTSSPDVFEEFFVSARVGLALADLGGRYVRANATYAALVGKAPEDLVGFRLSDVLEGTTPDDLTALAEGRRQLPPSEHPHDHPDGTRSWVLHGVTPVHGPDGASAWFAVSAQDITERRRLEQELRDQSAALTERAVRDPLTGLANRDLFDQRLRGALSHDARAGGGTGVLFLDLDGFKDVNDRHGHAVGDAVLRTVAQRLASAVRPADTVARLGGDEFVVLVGGATEVGMQALVTRLQAAVEEPIEVVDLTLDVGVSIGLALASDGAADPSGLVALADARMYAVKRRVR